MRTVLVFLALCAVAFARFGSLFKNLDDKQREELKAILHDQDATRAQIHQSVEEWIKKQPESVQKNYAETQKKREEWKKKHAEKHQELLSKVSEEAKKVDAELVKVWKNDQLTRRQTCEQINAIIEKTAEAIKTELHLKTRDCSKPFGRRHGGHRGNRHQKQEETNELQES
ncbi:hypothetical protein M3Y98_00237100 [Aphelenchoides besseyi]|nr:hypothetical protein M3Y98_00237100 [Aphelenchoides besseyi]KAI6200640.1 hypothetical protein M3Y96_00755300 [Aphelenchoides besseyi]